MTNYEKLVDTSTKGLACLCFPNKARCSVAEITEIFSEYGEIVGINCAGSETGFRFVRFRTKEEALRCAIGLDDHPKIQLQPVKTKPKVSDDNSRDQFIRNNRNNINDQRNNQISCNVEESGRADSTEGSQCSRNSKSNNNQRKNRDHSFQNEFNSVNHANGESSKENFNNQRDTTNDHNPGMKYWNSRSTGNFSKTKEPSNERNESQSLNNCLNAAKLAQLHKLRGTTANTFQPSDTDLPNNISAVPDASASLPILSSPPSSHHSSRAQSTMADMPPPLISGILPLQSGNGSVPEEQRVEVLHASDVIVANIHANIGISNIYHMFRNFSPIYVSDIETVPEINVRFCYVYFGTPKNALEVEKLFDGVSVHGKNLITLRSHKLNVESGIF